MRFNSFFRSRFFSSHRFGLILLLILTQIVFLQPVQEAAAAPSQNVQARAGEPQLILTKTIEGGATTAQVGDVIRYRVRFECSSLTTSCGVMTITDALQAGLTYLPPPNSSVPGGFTITETTPGNIKITKDDNDLLDGSQYDAVIAVRVDYNLRPLPAAINNQVNGTIDPPGPVTVQTATPANAPTITIGTVTPSWGITKTLFSPAINPTVDTDVTYQVRLCPTTPPPGSGNAPLQNIVVTDTLPVGSVFVSASNSGTLSAGVVTWPAVAGPIYPPNCISRYVTVRYPSSTFTAGVSSITNTANFTADYIPSSGTCTTPCLGPVGGAITHPIDPIAAVPTYNKNDAGDPVGINGTARFILNLNTNGTNYPPNAVVLIDNLPPQLQVTDVTSGGWSATFDYVRAIVEYSTNYGSSYTAFGTANYNTNATYVAPVTNITNVRWRFEYDPDGAAPYAYIAGLPYTWSFSPSPEIRVTPRAIATTATDVANTPMPPAVVNTTYNNCLQVSRVDNTGAVLDPCDNETMTVRGNYVSLQTYKGETNGASWDNLDDPNINVFTPDSNLLPGDTLRYTITVEVTERSSAPLIDPTIYDTLPADLVFVRNGTARLDGVILPVGQQPTFTQSGQNLTWAWNTPSPTLTVNPLVLGSRYLTVEFFARIPAGQSPGARTNNLYVVTDSIDLLCENPTQVVDAADVDGDTNTTESACRTTDNYIVERSAALRGEKWIRSTDALNSQVVNATTFLPDAACPVGGTTGLVGSSNPFTRFPCISQAYPEGALSPGQFVAPPPGPAINPALDDFEYNLRIFNDGNVNMLDYYLYDILPYYGDNGSGGTLASSSRNSEFRPVLRGPIEFISGTGLTATDFTIEYNATTNPCRPEVFNAATGLLIPAGCNNTWTSDWTTARSYRIILNPPAVIQPAAATDLRFGVPMYIPKDAPLVGAFNNDDPLSHEIAWNSFSHVGSYDSGAGIRTLLASEPRKVGITIPEVMSVGNRVWRDADNSGTINAPDDSTPGIAGVTVNLYRDTDNNGTPDGPAIATTTTDVGGYYLFSNIPYDSTTPANNRFIIGIPASNFSAGQPLESLRSSTGTPSVALYTNPPLNTTDSADDGIDPVTPGLEVFSTQFTLQPTTEPTSEADLSANDDHGPAGTRRGLNGERDNNSDLTIDFGFFGGTDVPFSIGNHVWKDNGAGGGIINDGIRQAGEPVVAGVTVRLYRDGNGNGVPEAAEMIRTDVTDVNGFYLFDNLDPGPYYVEIAAGNFASGQPLAGWYSSQPTGTETTGVNGGILTADIDNDDNGVNNNFPEVNGIFSGVVVLTRGTPEPTNELYLSGDTSSAPGFNPTAGDGPGSIGRFGETDSTSNLTIDFGFIPPMSLGNRVWIDEGTGTTPFRIGYNNGLQDGTEAGVSGVRVELWRDTNGTTGLQVGGATPDTFMYFTTTDSAGYYLFERLQPAADYFVHIPAVNFTAGNPLENFLSSTDAVAPTDNAIDVNDNGFDDATPATNGITSPQITMAYNTEPSTPANETDIPASGFGAGGRGNYGQGDLDSNLTVDFGFVRPPRSIGNRLWIDTNNNGQVNVGETPVPTGVRVSLYLDANSDNQPDDLGVLGDRTDDWIAYDLTDANGYYLFDKLPPNVYIVGVDRANFASGGLLDGYNSSTGNVDNATNNTDDRDNGVDRLLRADPVASPHGILSTRINLTATPVSAPTGEVGSGDTNGTLGFNPTAGDGPSSRGRFGETDANSDLTIDFGFFVPMSLGNRVFLDDGTGGGTYNNGIMDGGETPFANVRVELYRDANTDGAPDAGLVAFDVTDSGGYYLFDDLTEGSYVVLIAAGNFTASFDPDGGGPLPTAVGALYGYNSSTPTATENVGIAGNPYTPNTDRDDNGINAGNPSVTGILSGTITLAHNSEPTGESELSGQADPGSPANLAFNPTGWDGPTPGSRGRWDEIDANSNLTIDFGFIPVFSLGNRVFFDTNNNSLRNGAEVGINGVRVLLYASNGTTEILVGPDGILGTADDASGGMLTAGGGYYRFNNLLAGDYIVKIPASNFGVGQPLLGAWSSATTISNAGVISETTAALANTDTDNDDNGTLTAGDVNSSVVTLGPTLTSEPASEADLSGGQGQPDRQANMTVDFGFYTITLGNLVWGDTNNNGLFAGGETGINGVTVQLWSQDGSTQLATTSTAGGGIYSFTGLPQGSYIVRIPASNFNAGGTLQNYRSSTGVVPPSTYEPAPNPDTTTVDSDDNGTETGGNLGAGGYVQTSAFALTPAAEQSVNNPTGLTTENRVDFGFIQLVGLGNRVWLDTGAGAFSNNGILDAGEAGVNNVRMQLFTSTGVEVPVGPDGILGTADDALGGILTSGGGYYSFDRLVPGIYYVQIPASQFQAGGPLETYFSSVGNGANETSDQTADENGIDNATPATNGIRSTDFTLSVGAEQTGEDQSNYTGTLPDANVNFTDDFGFVQKYSLGNRVWFDTDNNSLINGSEVGVDGVTVNLYAASNLSVILATDTTSNGGYYLFDDLYPGDYVVSVDVSNFSGVLSGYWSSATSRNPTTGAMTETVAPDPDLGPDGVVGGVDDDFDSDDNGTLQNSGALNGSVISLAVTLGPSGNTEPTTETDLQPLVGQGNQANGRANMTVDFGFYKVSVGDLVWMDTDHDGLFDVGEAFAPDGTVVSLYAANPTTNTIIGAALATTVTASGLYSFDDLAEGNYIVAVNSPVGSFSTVDTNDSADTGNPNTNTNNNDNGVGLLGGTVYSNSVFLDAGISGAQNNNIVDDGAGPLTIDFGTTHNPTLDFGFTPVYSLGNRVWFDTNNNSTIDSGEVGINGVTVRLYSASDLTTILDTQTTANGGYYMFNGLVNGDYVVVIPSSNFSGTLYGYWSSGTARDTSGVITESAAPDADTVASDTDDNGVLQTSGTFNGAVIAQAVTLGPTFNEPLSESDLDATLPGNRQGQPDNQANMTVDFGFYSITLGDLVWNDTNNSGTVDGAEAGINGVVVDLYVANSLGNPVGSAIATATTSGAGGYTFTGLPQGSYIVVLPQANFLTTGALRNYYSSTGGGSEPAPNPDSDIDNSDDNGSEVGTLGFAGGYITSSAFALTPGAEDATASNPSLGITAEPRVDFGVFNSPKINLTVTKDDGVSIYLLGGTLTYTITVTNNGPTDVTGATVSDARPPQISSWTWTCDSSAPNASPATYACSPDNTNPTTFTDSLDLPNGASVTYKVTAIVNSATTGTLTNTVQVSPPVGVTETDNTDNTAQDVDDLAAMTVTKSDGVTIVSPNALLTYTITVQNTGAVALSNIAVADTLPADVVYQTGSASIAPSSIVGNVLTWTGINLAAGASQVITFDVRVNSAPAVTSIVNNVTATTTTPPITVSNGDTDTVLEVFTKNLISTDATHTLTPNVTIGEIITYELRMIIPSGSIANAIVVDTPQAGLAFVDCTLLTIPAGVTSSKLATGVCNDGTNPATNNPLITSSGSLITFDFGTVTNSTLTDQTIVINYSLVVLDITGNRNGTALTNNAGWTWTGGTRTASVPPVKVVEPQLTIDKNASPTSAGYGSVITFTIDIAHSTVSSADAFDVIVTDQIPTGLTFIPGSITNTGTAVLTSSNYNSGTNTLTFVWDTFRLAETASVSFNAAFVGPAPVVNAASVEWSTLQIDPALPGPPPVPVQLSTYNPAATERWYDPTTPAGVNNYVVSDNVRIDLPGRLPKTGFAPGVITQLPEMPEGFAYAQTNLWIEIPKLNQKLDIVGVPYDTEKREWDLTWLNNEAGWLENTAYPSHAGNSAITGHTTLPNGLPGPFAKLDTLSYGDQIIVHLDGQKYIFEVRETRRVSPNAVNSVLKHEEFSWLTLITCNTYDEKTGEYTYRSVARAVLIKVVDE